MNETAEVLLAHGSLNEIFLLDGPADRFTSGDEQMREFVRRMNDSRGPLGGDGLYFVDDRPEVPDIGFYNADGSTSSLCGNGLRCVMRWVMERRQVDELDVRIGANVFSGRKAADLGPGVPGIALRLPPVSFDPSALPMRSDGPHIDRVLPEVHPTLRFTAVAVPNPHLVAVVDSYDEGLLTELGERIADGSERFPEGVNVSLVVPLAPDDVFVRTYERGSGLTPSCGSGNVASRVVYSRVTGHPASARVTVRNVGGRAVSWEYEDGHTALEGNASFEYRATVSVEGLLAGTQSVLTRDFFDEERAAYAAVNADNHAALIAGGVPLSP